MYTVFRLSSKSETNSFTDAKKAFQEISPGLLENTKYEASMACDVYNGEDWAEYRNEIIQFIQKYKNIFDAFYGSEISFTFDMAVYRKDAANGFYCSYPLDNELLSLLSQNKIEFEFTAYYPIDVDDDEDDVETGYS